MASVGCTFIPAYTAAAEFRAANFLPAETWFFSEVTLRPSLSQLAGATRLANAFTSQPGWDAYVQRLTSPASGGSTNVLSDGLALLDGEVAIGAFGTLTSSSAMPQVVLLAHSSNPDQLIQTVGSAEGLRSPPTKDAHGANVYALPGQVALATFQGWIVAASTQTALQATLDRIAGNSSAAALSAQPRFKNLISRLPADRLALEYVDSGALVRAVQPMLLRNQPGLPPETQTLLNSLDSQLGMTFAAAPSGLELRIEGATRLPPEVADRAVATADVGDATDAFAHMPAETLVAFGTGLPPLTAEVDDALNVALQQAADQLGLPELADVELHLSQWLVGPIAAGGTAGSIGEPGGVPDLFLVAQVSDAAAARSDLASLASLLPPKSVTPIRVGGSPFLQFPVERAQPVSVGVANDWLYAVSGDAESVVNAAESGGLTDNPRFVALQSGLGDDSVNAFVDIQGIRDLSTDLLNARERQMYETEVRPLVSPLTFFGGGGRSEANGDFHGHFLLGINS